MQISVWNLQNPPQPVVSSGSGGHRQTGTTSSTLATHTSPGRHSLHAFSKTSMEALSKLLVGDLVRRNTLNGMSGLGVLQWHCRSSTSAAETVEPVTQGAILSRGRWVDNKSIWNNFDSRNRHLRFLDCVLDWLHGVEHSGVHSVHAPQLALKKFN